MSVDGRDWTKVPSYRRCWLPTARNIASMAAPFTQESLTGACPFATEVLIYGRSCRCGFGIFLPCPHALSQKALPPYRPPAPTTQ